MKIWTTFILLALVIVGVSVFVSRNPAEVPVDLGFHIIEGAPLWMSLLGSALLGAALTVGVFTWPLVSMRLQVRRSGKQVTKLEQEVHGLRTLPLNDEATEKQAGEV
ncbi:MAG: LapA family protein [bacterium]|nr:LapA family protein [bacterium]